MDFYSFGLLFGALIALVSSFFISNVVYQTYIFIISSTLLILLTKPFVKKFKTSSEIKTNAFSVIDKTGLVTTDISLDGKAGQVKIGSDAWTAISATGDPILKGTEVIVEKIDGVKLLVRPAKVSSVIK